MKKTVLVTRPLLVAADCMDVLQRRGFNPIAAPMLNISQIIEPRPLDHGNLTVYITSQIALVAMEDRLDELTPFFGSACYCVGEKTGAIARDFGFLDVRTGKGDGVALAKQLIAESHKNIPVLYISGTYTESKGAEFLKTNDFRVHEWHVYRASTMQTMPQICVQALKEEKLNAALFFSARTGKTFRKLIETEALTDYCRNVRAFVMSDAVAKAIADMPWKSVYIAKRPTLDDMITGLIEG